MRQIDLMLLARALRPGQAIVVSHADMKSCAAGSLSAMDTVYDRDIASFVKTIETTWAVSVTQRMDGAWTMRSIAMVPARRARWVEDAP